MKIFFYIVLCFFTAIVSLHAQPESPKEVFGELLYYSLEELMDVSIVTASKYSQRLFDAPANVVVITDRDIAQKGYMTLPDILRDVPMIDINSPGQGYQTDIGGRGVNDSLNSDKYWQLLIDGHNMTWHQFYRKNLSAAWLSVENIKRIEIVKGPSSSLWGANAYLGIINIITKKKEDIENGIISFGGGSNFTYASNLTLSGPLLDNGYIYSTISLYHENVSRKIKEWSEVKGDDVVPDGNDSSYYNSYTKIGYGDFSVKGMISIDKSKKAISSFSVGAEDTMFSINKYFVDAAWEHTFSNFNELAFSLYYDRTEWGDDARYEDNPYNDPITDPGNPSSDAEGVQHFVRKMSGGDNIYGSRIHTHLNIISGLSVVLGAEFEYRDILRWNFPEVWEAENLDEPGFRTYIAGGYGQVTYSPISLISIIAGARYDYHKIYKEAFSPRAVLLIKPVDDLVIKTMYGRAYKAPSIHELFYHRKNSYYGNPSLEPEYSNTYEGQIIYTFRDIMSISVSGFYIDMRDSIHYIERDQSEPLVNESSFPVSQRPDGTSNYYQQVNEGHSVTTGIESGMRFHPYKFLQVTLDGTYRYPINKNTNEVLNYAAKYKIFLSITYTLMEKFSFCLSGKYISSKKTEEKIFSEPGYEYNMTRDTTKEAPGYFLINFSFNALRIVENLNLLFKVENITNNEYYDAGKDVLYNQPGISFYGKLTYTF